MSFTIAPYVNAELSYRRGRVAAGFAHRPRTPRRHPSGRPVTVDAAGTVGTDAGTADGARGVVPAQRRTSGGVLDLRTGRSPAVGAGRDDGRRGAGVDSPHRRAS